MLEKIRIRTLLCLGFAVITMLSVLMALTFFIKSDGLAQQMTRIMTDSYPQTIAAGNIRVNVARNWANSLLLMHISDPTQAKLITDEMAANSKMISEDFDFLAKLFQSPQEKALLDEALSARKDYTANRKKYLALVKDGDKEAANAFLAKQLKAKVDTYVENIGKIILHNRAEMNLQTQHELDEISLLKTFALVLALLVSLVAAFVAYIVVRALASIIGGEIRQTNRILTQIAAGNLTVDVPVKAGDTTSLMANIKQMRDRLRAVISNINRCVIEVGTASSQLLSASRTVAAASEKQSNEVKGTVLSIGKMSAGIDQIAQNAEEVLASSQKSEGLSRDGRHVVQNATEKMGKIAVSVKSSSEIIGALQQESENISALITVIKEIADQTNLLALNAAIEAARAGEQGRGFAVVADEVRKLAERTTASTKEVSTTIEKIQHETRSAVESMTEGVGQVGEGSALTQQADESIQEIEQGATYMATLVSRITAAIQEQNTASTEISTSVENVAHMIIENSASAEQAATAASELKRLAAELAASVDSFKL